VPWLYILYITCYEYLVDNGKNGSINGAFGKVSL